MPVRGLVAFLHEQPLAALFYGSPEGNIEYLIMLDRKNEGLTIEEAHKAAHDIEEQSHELL